MNYRKFASFSSLMLRFALALLLALPALSQRVEVLRGGSEELKGVFFSGKPWLVQCVSAADITAASESGKAAVETSHAVLQLALGSLPKEVDVGLLNCKKRLPSGKNSGKNTLERFRLDDGISPLLILFANSRPPMQLTPALLNKAGLSTQLFSSARQQAAALVNLVTSRAEPKLWPVTKTEQLHDICVEKGRHCALILHQGELKPEAARSLKTLLPEFRTVHFITLNLARYDFSLARKLPEVMRDAPQLLGLRSAAVAATVAGEKARFSLGAKAHKGGFGTEQLREFLSGHVGGKLELTSLRKVPEIAWRKQSGGGAKAGAKADKKSDKGSSKEGASARGPTDRRKAYEERANAKRAEAAKKQGARSSGSGKARGKWQGSARGGSAGPAAAGAEQQQREAELRRRREMAEEEEYHREMFGYAGDEDGEDEGEDAGGGEDEDEEDFLDFDDDGGEDELNEGGSAGEEEDEVEAEEEERDGRRRTAVGADGSFRAM